MIFITHTTKIIFFLPPPQKKKTTLALKLAQRIHNFLVFNFTKFIISIPFFLQPIKTATTVLFYYSFSLVSLLIFRGIPEKYTTKTAHKIFWFCFFFFFLNIPLIYITSCLKTRIKTPKINIYCVSVILLLNKRSYLFLHFDFFFCFFVFFIFYSFAFLFLFFQ